MLQFLPEDPGIKSVEERSDLIPLVEQLIGAKVTSDMQFEGEIVVNDRLDYQLFYLKYWMPSLSHIGPVCQRVRLLYNGKIHRGIPVEVLHSAGYEITPKRDGRCDTGLWADVAPDARGLNLDFDIFAYVADVLAAGKASDACASDLLATLEKCEDVLPALRALAIDKFERIEYSREEQTFELIFVFGGQHPDFPYQILHLYSVYTDGRLAAKRHDMREFRVIP